MLYPISPLVYWSMSPISRTEVSLLGSPQKCQDVSHTVHLFFLQGQLGAGEFWSTCSVLSFGVGTAVSVFIVDSWLGYAVSLVLSEL